MLHKCHHHLETLSYGGKQQKWHAQLSVWLAWALHGYFIQFKRDKGTTEAQETCSVFCAHTHISKGRQRMTDLSGLLLLWELSHLFRRFLPAPGVAMATGYDMYPDQSFQKLCLVVQLHPCLVRISLWCTHTRTHTPPPPEITHPTHWQPRMHNTVYITPSHCVQNAKVLTARWTIQTYYKCDDKELLYICHPLLMAAENIIDALSFEFNCTVENKHLCSIN